MSINEQHKSSIVRGIVSCLVLNVFADEADPPVNQSGTSASESSGAVTINLAEYAEKIRKEEKDKLYAKMKSLEDENKKLVKQVNAAIISGDEKDQMIENLKAESVKGESEKVKDLKDKLATAEAEIKTLKENAPNVEEIEKKYKDQYELKAYMAQEISKAGNEIIPDIVQGNSKEEIDQSIAHSKERFKELVGNVTSAHQGSLPNVRNMPGINPKMGADNKHTVIPEEIQAMSRAEYAANRSQFGFNSKLR